MNKLLMTIGFEADGCASVDFTSTGLEIELELDIIIVVFLADADMTEDLRMITAAD